ncbi:MAG: hypothetical protein ACYC4U_10255 [Pirellulaceae bacterium]
MIRQTLAAALILLSCGACDRPASQVEAPPKISLTLQDSPPLLPTPEASPDVAVIHDAPTKPVDVSAVWAEIRSLRTDLDASRRELEALASKLDRARDDIQTLRDRLTERDHEREREDFIEGRKERMEPGREW